MTGWWRPAWRLPRPRRSSRTARAPSSASIVTTLAALPEAARGQGIAAPAMLFVGEVAASRRPAGAGSVKRRYWPARSACLRRAKPAVYDSGMKLHQLRYLLAVVQQGLNVTAAARVLHTSQPGVSKQIKLLEDEFGFQVFKREGRNLARITAAGQDVIDHAVRAIEEVDNIRRLSADFQNEKRGSMSIATTHTQARYVLAGCHHAVSRGVSRSRVAPAPGNVGADCRSRGRGSHRFLDRDRVA